MKTKNRIYENDDELACSPRSKSESRNKNIYHSNGFLKKLENGKNQNNKPIAMKRKFEEVHNSKINLNHDQDKIKKQKLEKNIQLTKCFGCSKLKICKPEKNKNCLSKFCDLCKTIHFEEKKKSFLMCFNKNFPEPVIDLILEFSKFENAICAGHECKIKILKNSLKNNASDVFQYGFQDERNGKGYCMTCYCWRMIFRNSLNLPAVDNSFFLHSNFL